VQILVFGLNALRQFKDQIGNWVQDNLSEPTWYYIEKKAGSNDGLNQTKSEGKG
jgi:hypothetical protein